MKKFKYYFKRYQFLIYVLGLIFAIIGSIQVFWHQYDNPIKGFFTVLYSVVKLFLFQPLVAFTNPDNPIIYDMAVILAPISTVIGLFSVFDTLFSTLKLKFTHFRTKHLVVMGTNDLAIKFMHNAKKDYRILCLAEHTTSQDVIDTLQRDSILVVPIDYDQGTDYENRKLYQSHKLNKSIAVVSFEDEPMNYGYIKVLAQLHSEYEDVLPVFIHHLDEQLKEVIQRPMDEYQNMDIRYFNVYNLMSFDLMQNQSFSLLENLNRDFSKTTLESKEDLTKALGKVHLLLVGFGELGQNILSVTSNQGTINPYQNLEVTLVDKNLKSKFERYDSRISHLERVADFNFIDLDLNSRQVISKLKEIHTQSPFTAVIFTLRDSLQSLLSLERMARVLPHVPIAIYSESMIEIKPLAEAMINKFPEITYFGEMNDLLTPQKILNEDNYAKAKEFNAYYNRVASEWMGWPMNDQSVDEQWLPISNIKKESSLYQTLHQNVKLMILNKLSESPSYPDSPNEIIQMMKAKLEGLSVDQQTDLIEQDVLMNFLSALEHKRWSNFYYMQDFEYADSTQETQRVHNCLIDDWDTFFMMRRDKVIYDLLSWLSLSHENS